MFVFTKNNIFNLIKNNFVFKVLNPYKTAFFFYDYFLTVDEIKTYKKSNKKRVVQLIILVFIYFDLHNYYLYIFRQSQTDFKHVIHGDLFFYIFVHPNFYLVFTTAASTLFYILYKFYLNAEMPIINMYCYIFFDNKRQSFFYQNVSETLLQKYGPIELKYRNFEVCYLIKQCAILTANALQIFHITMGKL